MGYIKGLNNPVITMKAQAHDRILKNEHSWRDTAYQWDINILGRREADQRDTIALLRQDSRHSRPTDGLEGVYTEAEDTICSVPLLWTVQMQPCSPKSTVFQISDTVMGHREQMISKETWS